VEIPKKIVSLIIPVYRNEGSIKMTFTKIIEVFENSIPNYEPEFVFIDDGSDDGSLKEIREIKPLYHRTQIISFSRNFGQTSAVIAGFRKCKGEMGVLISADLQDPPELIEKMIQSCERGNKIVICHRVNREDSLLSSLTSKLFYSLMHFANSRIPKGGFDFVLITRQVIDVFNKLDERNRFFQGDILWLGFPIQFIPYNRVQRKIGKSQWSFAKKFKYFIDGLLNTSYLPIRAMSAVGIIFSLIGFFYAFVILYLRLINDVPFKGYAVIVTLILSIGGLIMLMLGIIGEYLWRTYDETRKRPIYIINEENE
jgi:dolichol-phosphate mannosyltransferase